MRVPEFVYLSGDIFVLFFTLSIVEAANVNGCDDLFQSFVGAGGQR